MLGERADEVLQGPGHGGPPWTKDHRIGARGDDRDERMRS